MRVSQLLPHWHRGASSKSSRNLLTAAPAKISCFVVAAILTLNLHTKDATTCEEGMKAEAES